jgi:threonyl-tRNA synthetase
MIILVIIKAKDYIEKRRNLLHQLKLYADIDFRATSCTRRSKPQPSPVQFYDRFGAEEMEKQSINLRNCDDPSTQKKSVMSSLEQVITQLKALTNERRLVNVIRLSCRRYGGLN